MRGAPNSVSRRPNKTNKTNKNKLVEQSVKNTRIRYIHQGLQMVVQMATKSELKIRFIFVI